MDDKTDIMLWVAGNLRERDGTEWTLDIAPTATEGVSREETRRRRLRHFLTGGGLKAFRRTDRQDALDARQTRFLVFASALALAWFVAWIW